eukprot:SAG22_NODE_3865_length_1493_cov_1.964849_2_plen_309_part_00
MVAGGGRGLARLDAVATHALASGRPPSALTASPAAADITYLASSDEEHRANPEGLSDLPCRRVADYSGGYERSFPHRTIRACGERPCWPLPPPRVQQLPPGEAGPYAEYLAAHPHVTGLLVIGPTGLLAEEYRHARTPHHRLQSWSMAKSVTALLLGVCLDRGLVRSLDDAAAEYCPELAGTLHGRAQLRHLINMLSGAEVDHLPDNVQIYTQGFSNPDSSVRRTVAGWARAARPREFNYNELAPLAIGMVIRAVTGQSLSEFCEAALWQPLGAEADASWLTDSEGNEFNCIGFGCCLRDWGRLGRWV